MKRARASRGFTLVELLIVIVVIAILAAITIVAYGNVTSKAAAAKLQSDLGQAKTFMEGYLAQNGQYPADLATAESAGLKLSVPDNQVVYTVNNTVNPQTWALTVGDGTRSYYINNTTATSPMSGVWATNLIPNPSFEAGTTTTWGVANSATVTASTTAAIFGTYGALVTTSSTSDSGIQPSTGVTFTAGVPYTLAATITAKTTANYDISPQGTGGSSGRVSVALTAGQTQRISYTWTPTATGTASLYILRHGGSVGATTFYVDGVMLVQGSSAPSYADPLTSPTWSWNGVANASTSSGPLS